MLSRQVEVVRQMAEEARQVDVWQVVEARLAAE